MKTRNADKLYKAFLYTAMITLAVTVVVPTAWVVMASVKDNPEFYTSPWKLPEGFHYQNFINAWNDGGMGAYFLNSVIVTAMALIILLVIALPASYVLGRFSFAGAGFMRGLFMSGLFINVSYIVVPIFLMLVDADAVFGGGVLLNNRFVLALVYASTALPFTVYLLSGYMRTIPNAYEEAAMIDGCGYGKTMVRVILPMTKPSIITVLLFNFLAFWNEYIISLTLLTDDRLKTLPVGLMNLMKAQNASAQYGRLYAGLVIVMLPTLVLYILVQKKMLLGISVGGIKG